MKHFSIISVFAVIRCIKSTGADSGSWNEFPYPPAITQELPAPPIASAETPYTPSALTSYDPYDGNKLHYGPNDGGYGPPPNLIEHANHPSYFTGSHLAHVGYWIGAVWDKIITFLEPFAFLGLIANGIYVLRLMLPPIFFGTVTPNVVARKGKSLPGDLRDSYWVPLTNSVSENMCAERIACHLGATTSRFIPSYVARMMTNFSKTTSKEERYWRLRTIFLDSATGLDSNCTRISCEDSNVNTPPLFVSNKTQEVTTLGTEIDAQSENKGKTFLELDRGIQPSFKLENPDQQLDKDLLTKFKR